jgi:ATP-dependent protease Clp ATPase subunit
VARREHYCGFCGKPGDEVERMLAGPCIEVCNECIDMMYKLIHEPKPLLPVKASTAKPKKILSFREEARKRGRI